MATPKKKSTPAKVPTLARLQKSPMFETDRTTVESEIRDIDGRYQRLAGAVEKAVKDGNALRDKMPTVVGIEKRRREALSILSKEDGHEEAKAKAAEILAASLSPVVNPDGFTRKETVYLFDHLIGLAPLWEELRGQALEAFLPEAKKVTVPEEIRDGLAKIDAKIGGKEVEGSLLWALGKCVSGANQLYEFAKVNGMENKLDDLFAPGTQGRKPEPGKTRAKKYVHDWPKTERFIEVDDLPYTTEHLVLSINGTAVLDMRDHPTYAKSILCARLAEHGCPPMSVKQAREFVEGLSTDDNADFDGSKGWTFSFAGNEFVLAPAES